MRRNMTRFPPLPPSQLNTEQKAVYDEAFATCTAMLGDKFAWKDEKGALIGPLSPLIYSPALANLYLDFASELGKIPGLPKKAREVAILVTGHVFDSRYELYSHERLAAETGLSAIQIEAVKQGKKPSGVDALDEQCDLAFDMAMVLTVRRGPLSEEMWVRAETKLGKTGAMALVQYVALYSYTCILLNAVDEPVP